VNFTSIIIFFHFLCIFHIINVDSVSYMVVEAGGEWDQARGLVGFPLFSGVLAEHVENAHTFLISYKINEVPSGNM
jgi:hypothetical protein